MPYCMHTLIHICLKLPWILMFIILYWANLIIIFLICRFGVFGVLILNLIIKVVSLMIKILHSFLALLPLFITGSKTSFLLVIVIKESF